MKLKELGNLLNDQQTLYYEKDNHDIAINNGWYVMEKNKTIRTGKMLSNSIDELIVMNEQPQCLLDVNDVAERLGLSRQNITYHIKNENYKKVPKPSFYYENKSYKKYFWSMDQFE
ncbi:helix-turn-helix transcriptional regulator (plasmid) [Staphylococcus xylosus]|uniref:helix-turn-helix transcriptional regulator n=1 Tax=Staphylococcus xylosus TaxID=1288 RepID=UPI002DB84C33|nr:hypothetical protein [Staphylococcus xylosus]MEB8123122.1 hypothetical protein [Staphylococcus xylosus]